MTSWLERARNEIPKSAARPTANTADIHISSVTAVPKVGETEINGIPVADLHAIAGPDWAEVATDPDLLEALAAAVATRRMRERGEVPKHYTATTTCAGCGQVPIFEGAPERALACPWCFNRIAGKPVPTSQTNRSNQRGETK